MHLVGWGAGVNTGWTTDQTIDNSTILTFEDDTFTGAQGNSSCAFQAYYGARVQARYCVFNGCMFECHGNVSPGTRYWECYNNNFHGSLCCLRGGTGVVWGNTNVSIALVWNTSATAYTHPGYGFNGTHDPAYFWGNDASSSFNPNCNTCCAPNSGGTLVAGTEYFTSAKGGYTPLTYPHPLIGGATPVAPSINTQPQSVTVNVTSNATFTVAASGDSPLTYQWQTNGVTLSGATATSYTRANCLATDSGLQFGCVVANGVGSITSAVAVLTVVTPVTGYVDTNRVASWAAGVRGGIPNYSTVFADASLTPYSADKTGATDASTAIQNAINACPAGQIVYLPTGTYTLSNLLQISKSIVLRGDGPASTLLKSYAAWHCIQIGNFPSAPVATGVTGSPAKGAQSLTVASITSPTIAVGTYIVLDQINDGAEVINVDDQSRDNNTRCLSQMVQVTNITGSGPFVLGIDPPLYHNYATAQTPQVWVVNQGNTITTNAGLEALTIERDGPIAQNGFDNIKLVCCANVWLKNIKSRLALFRHVDIDRSCRIEVRDSLFDDGYFQGTGGYSYGSVCGNRSCDVLTENNIFYHLRHAMIVKEGAEGCVFGYNYSYSTYQADGWLAPDMMEHGCHASFNLFEGNYATKIDGDYTHGSGAYNTYFRNVTSRSSTAQTISNGRWCVNMDITQLTNNFIGNVLGSPGQTWSALETTTLRNSGSTYVWSFGFTGDGDTGQDSTLPHDSAFRHGNYDYQSGGITWDQSTTNHTLPTSLYLTSKPTWFGDRPYPWCDSASPSTAVVTNMPAGYRQVFGFSPSSSSAPAITLQPQSVAVNLGQSVTFTTAAIGTAPVYYQWQRGVLPIGGATATAYTFTPTLADNGVPFSVWASNSVATAFSSPASVTVTAQIVGTLNVNQAITPKITFGP